MTRKDLEKLSVNYPRDTFEIVGDRLFINGQKSTHRIIDVSNKYLFTDMDLIVAFGVDEKKLCGIKINTTQKNENKK